MEQSDERAEPVQAEPELAREGEEERNDEEQVLHAEGEGEKEESVQEEQESALVPMSASSAASFLDQEAAESDDGEDAEEDDDDDDDANPAINEYEQDGFLVLGESDEEPEQKQQRENKNARRNEERFIPLEDDDLDLIRGDSKKKRLKRLKRKGVIDSDEEPEVADPTQGRRGRDGDEGEDGEGIEGDDDDDDDDDAPREEQKSPSDRGGGPRHRRMHEEDDDGFIVGGKRARADDSRRAVSTGSHITDDQLAEWRAIFGDDANPEDAGAYDDDYVPEGEEGAVIPRRSQAELLAEEAVAAGDVAPALGSLFEPSVLSTQYLTKHDMEVRAEDVPERFQVRIPNRPPPENKELEAEVGWILRMSFANKRALSEMEQQDVSGKVFNVLHFLRNDLLEVPFIVTYRVDYVAPLGLDECWEIYDWDEKWHRLNGRKKQLLELYGDVQEMVRMGANERYIQRISDIDTEEEVEDLAEHFHYYFPEKRENADVATIRRPASRNRLQEAERSGYSMLGAQFVITATQFGENVFNNQVTHAPLDPSESPEDMVSDLVDVTRGQTGERILASLRSYLAHQVALDPYVRESLREVYAERLTVSTFPTEEKGIEEITYWHRFRNVKRIDHMPVLEFEKSDLFALILEAERTGYIRVELEVSDVLDGFQDLYQSKAFNPTSTLWNKQRRLILTEALSVHLHPHMKQEMRLKLQEGAFSEISHMAVQELNLTIARLPLERAESQFYQDELEDLDGRIENFRGPLGFHTMAVVVPADHQESPFVVVVDVKGNMVQWIKTSFLEQRGSNVFQQGQIESRRQRLQKEDADKIRALILEFRPGVIAISAHPGSSGARLAYEAFQTIQGTPGPILAPILVTLKQEQPRVFPKIHWVDGRVAHVLRNTSQAMEEHPDYSPPLREALSAARIATNPLAEYARLCDVDWTMGYISFHPLQHVVPRKVLQQHFEHAFINATCEVGVDVNAAAKSPHLAATLQFVPGLGPRKARGLLNTIIHSGKSVDRRTGDLRDMLTNNDTESDHVFCNAIAYLKVIKHDKHSGAPLDASRVHPNDYRFALKIAVDAADDGSRSQEGLGEDEPETEKNNIIRAAMLIHNEEIRRTVDVRAMATIWKDNYGEDKFRTLEMVKDEMLTPWRDNRLPSEVMEPRDAFFIVFEESPATLPEGKLMRGVVRTISMRGQPGSVRGVAAYVDLEDGVLSGQISRENVSDRDIEDVCEVLQVGQPVTTRLNFINFERWELDLTAKTGDLQDLERFESAKQLQDKYPRLKWKSAEMERYRLEEEKHEAERERQIRRDRQGVATMRVVDHPSFRNFTADDVRNALEDAPVGEPIFRPSTRGSDFLTLSYKGLKNQVVHMVVVEKDKPNSTALGRRLSIKGFNDEYEDLDEVIARYVNPIAQFMTELSTHKRFSPLSEAEIQDLVRDEKRQNPAAIVYKIGIAEENPGWFKLFYLPGQNTVQEEIISLRPVGYRLRRRMFPTLQELLKWFGRHWNDQEARRGGAGDQGSKRSRR